MIPNFELYYKNTSDELEVILCGSSNGMGSEFMDLLFQWAKKRRVSVVIFNYPYFDRLEKRGMGESLDEEIIALRGVLEACRAERYKRVKLVGKSIGAVVAGRFLATLSKEDQLKYELVVLGYDLGWIKIKDFIGNITIIQGEKDPFGDVSLVKKDMEGAASTDIKYYEIKGADHSYREPGTGAPKFQQEVVDLVSKD